MFVTELIREHVVLALLRGLDSQESILAGDLNHDQNNLIRLSIMEEYIWPIRIDLDRDFHPSVDTNLGLLVGYNLYTE